MKNGIGVGEIIHTTKKMKNGIGVGEIIHTTKKMKNLIAEVKALMSIIPTSLEQAEAICESIEKAVYGHPEIEAEIKQYLEQQSP